MKKIYSNNYFLAILSGLLFTPGWFEWGTGLTMLIAFVPLLVIFENLVDQPRSGKKIYLLASLTILVWNILTTWWIKNASFAGLLAALFISVFFMSWPIWLSFKVRKAWGQKAGLFALVVFWLAFEYAFLHGEISWPWLVLGNGFAYEVRLFQWYDLTGALGGTLWVLLVNIFIFQAFFSSSNKIILNVRKLIWAGAFLVVPIVFSLVRYYTYEEQVNPRKIIVVQPNIDAYLKFNDIPSMEQTKIQVDLAFSKLDSTVDYVVAPETSIINSIWIGKFDQVSDFKLIKSLVDSFPKVKYVTGIICNRLYAPGDSLTKTAQQYGKSEFHFDTYNSAIQIDTSTNIQLYHKSQLVTGVEKMPYPALLKIIKPLTLKLGGAFRSHATQKYREVFTSTNDSISIAPVICYESIFGDYITDYVKLGAGLIFVITNDGWWGDTPGHRQHNSFSSIRAVEMRRSVARSANTGISSFINQRGDILQRLNWWERNAIVAELNVNNKITFFAKHGDYIGRTSFFSGILLVLFLLARFLKRDS